MAKRRSQSDINFLKAAGSNLQKKFAPSPKTSMQVLEYKAKTLAMTVQKHIIPILKAGGGLKPGDLDALEATMFTMFVQGFDSSMFSKEELIHLCAMLHAQAMRASVEADPHGSGTPDLLSGQ